MSENLNIDLYDDKEIERAVFCCDEDLPFHHLGIKYAIREYKSKEEIRCERDIGAISITVIPWV